MTLFQDWFHTLPYKDQLMLASATFYVPKEPNVAVLGLARAIRRATCKIDAEGNVCPPQMIDSSNDPVFGSLLSMEALADELYIAAYRADIAAGEIPKSREDFDKQFLKELEEKWETHTEGWKLDLSAQIGAVPLREIYIIFNALRVIWTNHPDRRVGEWMGSVLKSLAPHADLFATEQKTQ